jgi:hypothetical protein|tara:strand:- start:495 stop:686 length:192 start_codon:yes stop_codon:yes gene_type:complete
VVALGVETVAGAKLAETIAAAASVVAQPKVPENTTVEAPRLASTMAAPPPRVEVHRPPDHLYF